MGPIRSSRPSPAIVVAVLALVAALAGTAVGNDRVADTSALKKKKVKKIARKGQEAGAGAVGSGRGHRGGPAAERVRSRGA
jgi:hypothetical protein